ncbi:SigB/SigF/SigG family RNA polymerase sigma factor [Quadrisphaera sp. KR29]|uniref:SigB/SigF/SigG family RNA polymerase sigma factor n=1 Tax=Quadrisphaera sp. KR29 TaxID=3461391 RepID=UPI0040445099
MTASVDAPEAPSSPVGSGPQATAPTAPSAPAAPASAPGSAREQATEELLARASVADGAERARLLDEVVVLNLPVAKALAARFRDRGEQQDDLVQVASLALVKAAQGYQPGKGRGFLPYAVPTITGELRRHFRDRQWGVRPPRRLQELRLSLGAAAAELTQKIGRAPTVTQLSEHLGVDQEEVIEALAAAQDYHLASLDAPMDGEADGTPLGATLGEDDGAIDRVVDHVSVAPLLASLPERDRRILSLRFFRGWTQSQIAADIGVTQMQVSRLLARTLERLRAQLEDAEAEAA